MRKYALLAALLLPFTAIAQQFGARTSVEADVKIQKGLHLGFEEELRVGAGKPGIDNVRSTLGLSWKASKYLKIGAGYTLINPYKFKYDDDGALAYKGFWNPRHRIFAEATGQVRFGDFQLSLKEKLQFTRRTDDSLNVYQTNPNALALKSRIGVKYRGLKDYGVEPFGHFEVRTALNDPWGEISGNLQQTDNSKRNYYDYTHTGYSHIYNNRYRVNLGADYSPLKNHTLTANVLLDFCSDYEIDTNSPSNWEEKGVRLFTDTTGWNDYFCASLCLSYKISF
jgi:hypothetical protein